jgi:DNA repair protein RadA/Sms
MTKSRSVFRCNACGGAAPQWVGRCPACGAWDTLVEERARPATRGAGGLARVPGVPPSPARPICELDGVEAAPAPTGIAELDRVLGGGLVPGSVTLVGGEPGIGKSTLLLQLAARVAEGGRRVLYVSAEESRQQVRLRAVRLGAMAPALYLAADSTVADIVAHLDAVEPELAIVDSIQTVHDPERDSAPGSVTQVRECAHALVAEAKARGLAVVIVGHVTKDGHLAGPRVLEHVVDTVLAFEGDRHHGLRLLRAVKHRFGATDEVGVFEMTGAGLAAVADPSELFLADRRPGIAGSVVVPTIDGHRPLLVEVQALVAPGAPGSPRRAAQGVDSGRLAVLLAVVQQRLDIPLATQEVYAVAVGGVRVAEPGADLGIALALVSSANKRAVPPDVAVFGEIGLAGELRQVGHADRRLAEAARLGFRTAVVPARTTSTRRDIRVVGAATVAEAAAVVGLLDVPGVEVAA